MRKAADPRSAVRIAANSLFLRVAHGGFFFLFLERKWRFSLNVFHAKKRKKRRRRAVQEEGNEERRTHACCGVDGKFNVTAAVADLSEGSWLTVCWPMRGVERSAHCRL